MRAGAVDNAPSAVELEVDLAFHVDGLDELADRLEEVLSRARDPVAAGRPQDPGAVPGPPPIEPGGDVALAGDDPQAGPVSQEAGVVLADRGQDLPVVRYLRAVVRAARRRYRRRPGPAGDRQVLAQSRCRTIFWIQAEPRRDPAEPRAPNSPAPACRAGVLVTTGRSMGLRRKQAD
jgi:hypothetical protein